MVDKSIQELQTEFRKITEELQLRVKEMRDAREGLDEQVSTAIAEGTTKLEERIAKLQKAQEDLEIRFKAPRLSAEDTEKVAKDKRVKAFLGQMRYAAGLRGALTSEEREALPEHQRALVENSTGQILVPEDLETEIIRTAADIATVRPLATVRSTTRDRLRRRSITEVSMSFGGKLETGGTVTESTSTPSEEYQYVEDANGLAKLGEDELMDTDTNLIAFLVDSFARAKADLEDEKFITGSGHSSVEPEGILNGSTVTRVAAASATAIAFNDLLNLMKGYNSSSSTPLKSVYVKNGVFMMSTFTELAVMKLKDSNGQYLWRPTVTLGTPATIWGHPVYINNNLEEIATGNDIVIFGDIRAGYRILDRTGMTIKRLNELYSEADLVGFKAKVRLTGGIIRAAAMRILQNA